jgi:hypothetical protein
MVPPSGDRSTGVRVVREQKQVIPMEEKHFALPPPSMGGGESPLSVSANAGGTALAPPPHSDMEKACRLFGEEVGRLPGVLRVERWGEVGPGAPTFHVYLRPDDRETEYAVYEVKGQVYDRYPGAYLDVVVLEAGDAAPSNTEPGA